MFALTALIGSVAVTMFVFHVMLVVSDRASAGQTGEAWDEARDGTWETLGSTGDIGVSGVRLIGSAFGILSIPLLVLIGALLVTTAIGIGFVNFGDELSGSFDSAFTEIWPPFYRNVVLGVADPLLSLWNIIIPTANSLNGSWRIFRSNLLQQAVDCEGAKWSEAGTSIRDAIFNFLSSLLTWVIGLANDDFDLYTPLRDLQIGIDRASPVIACWCEATSFMQLVTVEIITSHQLAAVFDRAVNLVITVVKDLLGTLVTYFRTFGKALLTGDDFFDALGDYYWEPNRHPSIERSVRTLGQLSSRMFDFLDDVIVAFVRVFFTLDRDEIPRWFGITGNFMESFVLDFMVIADSWGISFVGPVGFEKSMRRLALLGTRYDNATWEKSRPTALRTQDLLTDAFAKAYNASALSEVFFQTWKAPLEQFGDSNLSSTAEHMLNLTGCMSHEVLDVLTATLELTARAWVAAFHERIVGGDYGEYVRGPPMSTAVDLALDSSIRFGNCAGAFYSEIDDELGRFVNETGHVIKAMIVPFVELQRNWDTRKAWFESVEYSNLVDEVFFEMDAWAIAFGNFFRQFSFAGDKFTTVDPDVECRVRDPHSEQSPATDADLDDWELFYPWYVDPFCCLGGAIEEYYRLLIGLIEGLTRGIVAFTQEATFKDGFVRAFKTGGPLDLRVEFLPMLDFLLRDVFRFSCIKFGIGRVIGEAFFGTESFRSECNAGGDTIWEFTVEVGTGIARVPLRFLIGGAAEIWSWIVDLADVGIGGCGTDCWCGRLKTLYKTTLGVVFDWVANVLDLVACLFELPKLSSWTDDFIGIMGSGGSIATGDFFCVVVDFFANIFELLTCWADGGGFFTCLFETILSSLRDLVDRLIDCLKSAWSELKEVILCIPASIWNWVEKFFANYSCLWDGDKPCPKLLTFMKNCKFVVPAECGRGSLGLTTGEVFFTFTDLPTETATKIISNCDIYDPFSPEWLICVQASVSTSVATYTRHLEYEDVVKREEKISDTQGGFTGTLDIYDAFGSSVGLIGDLDQDGIADMIVGAPGDDDGTGNDRGAAWVLFMEREGTVRSHRKIGYGALIINTSVGDNFGCAVAGIGDLNGDGPLDVAVGALNDDDGGFNRGAVWIVFLDTDGTINSQQKISDLVGGFTGTLVDEDSFGSSVASLGDLDGDGVNDIAVGALGDDTGGTDRGAVWILFMNIDGTVKSHQKISDTDGDFTGTLVNGDNFGSSVASLGDLDGDGIIDLAVGAPGSGTRGAAWILLLNSNGKVKHSEQIDPEFTSMETSINAGSDFGSAVVGLGDLDGDGVVDVAIGASKDDASGFSIDVGAVYVIYLKPDGSMKGFSKISQGQGGFRGAIEAGDEFGRSLAILGDLDGDGITELAIGAPIDPEGGTEKGAVWITFLGGESSRVRRQTDFVKDETLISSLVGGLEGGLDNSDNFGWSSASLGDFDADGLQEVAVGAPFDDDGGDDRGAVYILTLRSDGRVKRKLKIGSNLSGFTGDLSDGDSFGYSVAAIGDLDGDNVTDMIVGAVADGGGPGATGTGAAWILFLNLDGTVKADQKIGNATGGFVGALSDLDQFGASVTSLGDLDGDNITDIAIGAPWDDDGGIPPDNYGAVWILFLNSNGTVKAHQKISGSDGAFGGTLDVADEFGTSVSGIGDLDGDGIPDLAVGAPGDDDGGTGRGAVWILFMETNGTVKSYQKISDTAGEFDALIRNSDGFGTALSILGDVDGDGVADLAVGSPADDEGGIARGALFVMFMRTDGNVKSYQKIGYYQGGFLGQIKYLDRFGRSISPVGDIDGDGVSDIFVGMPFADSGSIYSSANRGAAWTIFLNEFEPDRVVLDYQKISDLEGNFTGVLDDGDSFGSSVTVIGDLDDDNVTDVAIGAPFDDDVAGAGAIWILFLQADGQTKSYQKISATEGNFTGALGVNDFFGTSVTSIGDLNGDGVVDLAVGAPGDEDGGSNHGAVWILFLHANGTVDSSQKISDTEGDFTGALDIGDSFGNSVTNLGDLDGDNVTDLAVGTELDDDGNTDRGAVWILFMNSNGTVKAHQKISDTDGDFTGVLDNSDNFGVSVSGIGDLDGDGVPDLATGARLDDDGGTFPSDRGAVWILFLHANGTVKAHQKISDLAGSFIGVLNPFDGFSISIDAVGDLDGDGLTDLAVGAPGDDDGGTNRGAVWLLYLNSDGTVKRYDKISYTSGDFIGLIGDGDQFGISVAALGDFDGDGTPDVLVGASTDSDGGTSRGAVWSLYLADRPAPVTKRRADALDREEAVRWIMTAAAKKRANLTTSWSESTSGDTATVYVPEVIEFEDIEKWCQIEGSHLGALQEAIGINENSSQISDDQKEINRRLINATLYEMSWSYHACLASATTARIVDIGIGFVSKNETLVPPKTFYEPIQFMYFASRVIMVVPIALEYHFDRVATDPRLLTRSEFVDYIEMNYNITDELTMHLGLFADRMLRAARLLVYDNRANMMGYLVNTFGQLFYVPAPPSANNRALIYGSAPLHPAGWRSPKWLAFRDRYVGGLRDGFNEWQRAAGVEDRTWTLDYITALPSVFQRRLDWNRAGRVPDDEPYPRGRLAQRARYENLVERETATRHAWESNETAEARRLYARSTRLAKYPSLSTAYDQGHQDLISSDFICPIGVRGRDFNCTDRACWAADGTTVGVCDHKSDLLGRPICDCDYASLTGACCGDSSCTNEANAAACGADSTFAPTMTCASGVCAHVRGACCAQNGTCSEVSKPQRCPGSGGTFLLGTTCGSGACDDSTLIKGACCDAGACSMTVETACAGTWNINRNCSSRALAAECEHCGAPPCLSCDLLFATVNDVIDLWILNLELINESATRGACCYGGNPTNRSCDVNSRSACNTLTDSVWFWGEQCSFCQSPFAFAVSAPQSTVRRMAFERDLDTIVLESFGTIFNFALNQSAKIFPSLEGVKFDPEVFSADVAFFFFSDDSEDPKSVRFWFDFFFFCDVFDHLFPDVGPQGLGLISGLFWATIILTILYQTLFKCWPFLGGLISGIVLLFIFFFLVLIIAYFYSPACYAPAIIPRYVFRGRQGKAQAAHADLPAASRFARVKTRIMSAARQFFLVMFSIPQIPVRLGQDFRDEILAPFDVDCLAMCDVACPHEEGLWPCGWVPSLDEGLKCLDAPDCCAAAECPKERLFPDCSAEPYNIRGSTRELAYWFRTKAPKANCFLLHTDFFLVSWLRQIPSVADRLDFPGDECSEPDFVDARWQHCAKTRAPLLAPWIIVLILVYIFIWGIIALLWVTIKALLRFGRRAGNFTAAASRGAVRATQPAPPPPPKAERRRKPTGASQMSGAGLVVTGHSRTRDGEFKVE